MRFIRALTDLPWWCGLPIFLVGTLIVPLGIFGYMVGISISLFGCWIFSKLLEPNKYKEVSSAICCLVFFFLVMGIPYRFSFSNDWVSFMNHISPTILYITRSSLGIFFGMLTFNNGFR